MKRTEEITSLSREIMLDVTNDRVPLHCILLKASQLSLLLDMPQNSTIYNSWAKKAEENQFVVGSFQTNIEAAKDPAFSLSSANPNEKIGGFAGSNIPRNFMERNKIRTDTQNVVAQLASYRAFAYKFALGVYNKWQFGNIAESIFEKKRKSVEPILQKVFPDINQRLNSIERNLLSDNPEDWKNTMSSCRALMMDIADLVNPPKVSGDKQKYIDRIKNFISPKIESKTKKAIVKTMLDELKERIEYTVDYSQSGAHNGRPDLERAQDVVLYTYLAIAEIISLYKEKEPLNSTVDQTSEVQIKTKSQTAV